MTETFINLTLENLQDEHLCCIIRSRTLHPGVEAKRQWLASRLPEGHIFRKLNQKATVFIEYAPVETAWVPVTGSNYYYIYCLWVAGGQNGKGYGKALMEYCIADAKAQGKAGICMLGARKQKAWLSNQDFAKTFGFSTIDTAPGGYELLALAFDPAAPVPQFSASSQTMTIDSPDLTVYYDYQCPFMLQNIESIQVYCQEHSVPLNLVPVDSLEKAKNLPCVFNNFAVFYKGQFETVNLLPDPKVLERILRK